MIAGQTKAVNKLKDELAKHFQCKFNAPKDFLGLNITNPKKGEITLSMQSFTEKMQETLGYQPKHDGPILTPGRTDIKKIVKGVDIEPNDKYRSKVGILNWLTMGIRLDLVNITKELSRVLTKIANELVERAIEYTVKSKHAHLTFSHKRMTGFTPPPTRKKPSNNQKEIYEVNDYNQDDGIQHIDEKELQQDYIYKGEQITVTCQTDIDLAGQVESRQSTSGYVIYLNGALVHYQAATERIIIQSTAAGEYIALSRGNTATKFVRDVLKFLWKYTTHLFLVHRQSGCGAHCYTA